jgi:hypothetical protein
MLIDAENELLSHLPAESTASYRAEQQAEGSLSRMARMPEEQEIAE